MKAAAAQLFPVGAGFQEGCRLESIRGFVDRITFRDEKTGYSVLRIRCEGDGAPQSTTAVGVFPVVIAGELRDFYGDWVVHPQYGRQFKVEDSAPVAPNTAQGIEAYLGSGAIRGVGRATAKKIVKLLGEDALKVIEEDPQRLVEIPGLSMKKAMAIASEVSKQKELHKVMVFLAGIGVTPSCAVKVYRTYGDNAISVIKKNPYRLADDVYGIGFKRADAIALKMGIDPSAPERIRAGIIYVLSLLAEDGHAYYPLEMLRSAARDLLSADESLVMDAIRYLASKREITVEDRGFSMSAPGGLWAVAAASDGGPHIDPEAPVYLNWLHRAETETAERLVALARGPVVPAAPLQTVEKLMAQLKSSAGIELTPLQQKAVSGIASSGVLVLTGGPGTGKTTTIRSVVRVLEALGLKVALAAPTGRAAKRLQEATGREARTLHRLLEVAPEGGVMRFQRNEDCPLDMHAVVLDEVSMIDLPLMASFLRATRPGMRILLVGDKDQLPSVGPGAVLRDIIASREIPVIELKEIFRQARESMIVVNAHRINEGKFPILAGGKDGYGEFLFIEEEDPQKIPGLIRDLVETELPGRLQCDPFDDIQVLSPMRKTITGVDELNNLLQNALNPPAGHKPELKAKNMVFRQGDKVMQVVNNYDKMVYNGDLGRVVHVDPRERVLGVRFSDQDGSREVEYEGAEVDQLVLAYAASVHKSQGSEYPVVVMPITTQHYIMLQRNLLYTAVTRARRAVILVGTKKAIAMAVRNDRSAVRYSGLASRIKSAVMS